MNKKQNYAFCHNIPKYKWWGKAEILESWWIQPSKHSVRPGEIKWDVKWALHGISHWGRIDFSLKFCGNLQKSHGLYWEEMDYWIKNQILFFKLSFLRTKSRIIIKPLKSVQNLASSAAWSAMNVDFQYIQYINFIKLTIPIVDINRRKT